MRQILADIATCHHAGNGPYRDSQSDGRSHLELWVACLVSLALGLGLVACRGGDKPARPTISTADAGMVAIPAGAFTLGVDDGNNLETPARPVTTSAYWIDKYEYPNVLGEIPLVNVTWHEAEAKCAAVGKRLCTEREWEKACRGPENWLYPYGQTYGQERCRTEKSWEDGSAAIGTTQCMSGYGVADMSGNVQEWTLGESVEERAMRGGFWQSGAYQSRCSTRTFFHPTYKDASIGFRCCKSEDES